MELENKDFEKKVIRVVEKYDRTSAFSKERYTDTPSDALSIVNRRFVTLNGSVAGRPNSSVATVGQFYLAGTQPMWFTGTSWVNGVASVVA